MRVLVTVGPLVQALAGIVRGYSSVRWKAFEFVAAAVSDGVLVALARRTEVG